jgi:hypothetical protein
MVNWTRATDIDGIPITGYLLLVDDGLKGDFKLVYDGSEEP